MHPGVGISEHVIVELIDLRSQYEVVLAQAADSMRPYLNIQLVVMRAEIRVVPFFFCQFRQFVQEFHERRKILEHQALDQFSALNFPAFDIFQIQPCFLFRKRPDTALAGGAFLLRQHKLNLHLEK